MSTRQGRFKHLANADEYRMLYSYLFLLKKSSTKVRFHFVVLDTLKKK